MRHTKTIMYVCTVLSLVLTIGCASKSVTRIHEDTVTDLSGRWNDTDSRLVSDEMIQDCLTHRWTTEHWKTHSKKPVLIVGVIQNKSSEHIAVGTFIGDIERTFINSGDVEVVATAEEREQVRDERADQQMYSTEASMKKWGLEKGADYMMGGVINTITDEERGQKVVFYQVDLNLVNLETNAKIWIGQKKIKKFIKRRGTSF